MSHDQRKRDDHRHPGPANEHADKTGTSSLHGKHDHGTEGAPAERSGRESKRAGSESLTPPGDPREPSRDEWEEIAKNQGLLTPEDEMPTPHRPR